MDSIVQHAEQQVRSDYKRVRWTVGLSGALSIAVGVLVLIWPGISLFALTILWGAYMIAAGVLGLSAAISGKFIQKRGWLAFFSVLSIAAGVAVIVWPNIGALTLLYIIGAYAIAFGIVMAGGAFWLPLQGTDKALLLFSGFVSILFGIVMFAAPGDGALVVLALIAAFALVIGISELVLAIGGKRLAESRLKDVLQAYEPQQTKQEPKPQPSS
jgi:uncharacterized membrane protein HdeD (DUF308 family)